MLPPLPELTVGLTDSEQYDACKQVLDQEIAKVNEMYLRLKAYTSAGMA